MAYSDPHDPRAKAARRRHYEKNKEAYKARAGATKRRNRQVVDETKHRPCADCEVEYPSYVMQFDHVRGEKVMDVARMVTMGVSLEVLLTEIAKCDVVCANCHAERTHQRHQERRGVVQRQG